MCLTQPQFGSHPNFFFLFRLESETSRASSVYVNTFDVACWVIGRRSLKINHWMVFSEKSNFEKIWFKLYWVSPRRTCFYVQKLIFLVFPLNIKCFSIFSIRETRQKRWARLLFFIDARWRLSSAVIQYLFALSQHLFCAFYHGWIQNKSALLPNYYHYRHPISCLIMISPRSHSKNRSKGFERLFVLFFNTLFGGKVLLILVFIADLITETDRLQVEPKHFVEVPMLAK